MSPKTKKSVLSIGALASAILVLAAALKPVIAPSAKAAIEATMDSTYVFQQSYKRQKITDSLTHDREIDEIRKALARVDSNSQCSRRRKPSWCD